MVAKVKTFSFSGINVELVDVEVKISSGLTAFNIVGLPDKAVGESKERVRSAITSTGLSWPFERITVNLAPADLQKEGSHFDLAIALAIMVEMGVLEQKLLDNYFILGELSLDGSINKVNGTIIAAIGANERNCGIICPLQNGSEAAWAGDLEIIAVPDILSLINHLKNEQTLERPKTSNITIRQNYPDFLEVKGQETAKRALEIAAAGGHNLLMIGPPGTGKSMLASRLPGILPDLTLEEILQVNMIGSIDGKIKDGKLLAQRPFIAPHHSTSMPAMVGGGSKIKPGAISLAHNGILFLDELAEFPRVVLDSLRQPLETGQINISRVNGHVIFPANFQLIAAMNPCKCGYLGDGKRQCKKAPICGADYQNKISGPFLDRIDIIIHVGQVDIFNNQKSVTESSQEILTRVLQARKLQEERYKNEEEMKNFSKINAKISSKIIEKFCFLEKSQEEILQKYIAKNQISMRSIARILKVARTIADLENSLEIKNHHLLEAISYRRDV